MKKALCFIMALGICTSVFLGGCGWNGKKEGAEGLQYNGAPGTANPLVTPPGQFPVVKGKYTLKIFAGRDSTVSDLAKNEFTDIYEQMTNVHVEWDQVPQAQAKEKANIILASRDLPDLFMNAGMPVTQVLLYGTQGVFIPLNDLIDTYSVHFNLAMQKSPYVRENITAPNGKIYGLPRIDECYHCTNNTRMWMNTAWLKTLGLEVPETTEDFYHVLKAFKTRDANGNGKADEIALTAHSTSYHLDGYLMSAFIYNDNRHGDAPYLELVNGRLRFVANTPEWKQGLQYMRRLYDEKLIAPESFTQNTDQLKRQGEALTQVLGAVATYSFLDFTVNYGSSGRYLEYDMIPPLKGPNGVRWTVTRPFSASPTHTVITSSCKNPEVAMRWLDYFYSFEGTQSTNGAEGKMWQKVPDGASNPWISLRGEPALFWPVKRTDTTAYGNLQNIGWKMTAPAYKYQALREGSPMFNMATTKTRDEYKMYHEYRFLNYVRNNYEPYKKKEVVTGLMYTEQQASRAAELRIVISEYVRNSTAKFITGQLDVEKDWSDYTRELERMNVAEYVKTIQEVYDARRPNTPSKQ